MVASVLADMRGGVLSLVLSGGVYSISHLDVDCKRLGIEFK